MRKSIALLLAFAMSLSACSTAAEEKPAENQPAAPTTPPSAETPAQEETSEPKEDVVILYTNDAHTYIDGPISYDVIAGLKDALEEKYNGNVLLLDAGDHVQGTAYGSTDKGATIVELMNMAGYDAATMGNHEFDYGMDGFKNVVEWADYDYLSCNFHHESDGVVGENILDSYKLFDLGGQSIAVVGISTPETITKSTPIYFQNEMGAYIYGFSGGEDGSALVADVQKAIDSAKDDGADIVIALGHLGDETSSSPWTSEETIAKVSGIDAFIDGHSHSSIPGKQVSDKNGENVLLTQTGQYFDSVGMLHIDGESGEITSDLISYIEITEPVLDDKGSPILDEDGKPTSKVVGYEFDSELYDGPWVSDPAVTEVKEKLINQIEEELGVVIGFAEVTLDNYDSDGKRLVRSQETNSGDFSADAHYYLFDNMGLDVDVAILNGGGVRNNAVSGELTYKTTKEIHTFGNVACLQTISGQQLLDALEWGARTIGNGEESGGFLHVAGIQYTIDTQWPNSVQEDELGVWIGPPTGGYRVHDVKVYNKETQAYEPLDLEAKYNIAGQNYILRDLGSGCNMFSGAVNVLDYVMEDYMVLAEYIQAFENGVVGATNSPLLEKYPNMLLDYSDVNGCGRIIIE